MAEGVFSEAEMPTLPLGGKLSLGAPSLGES